MQGIVSVSVVIGLALATAVGAAASTQTPDEQRLYQSCRDRGGEESACVCVAREVRSRFDEREQDVLLQSMGAEGQSREQRAEALQQSGMDSAELSALVRRMVNAETVIQQTCGAGFMRVNPRR